MSFPNVFVKVDGVKTYDPTLYMDGSSFTPSVEDASVATAEYKDGKIHIKGLKQGQTKARVSNGSLSQEFVITVREKAEENGWL
jgi:hypothetical protein